MVLTLLGRLKSEEGDRMHVFPVVNEAKTGVKVRVWLEIVACILDQEGKKNCPAFYDIEGYQLREKDIMEMFQPILESFQEDDRDESITRGIEVRKFFCCSRSFRRGTDTKAFNNGLDATTIACVHRWSRYETNIGAQPGSGMLREHYAAGSQLTTLQLRFFANV